MFKATRYFETNKGVFKKGSEVPAEVAETVNPKFVEKIGGSKPKKAKKEEVVEVQEEILTEDSADVSIEEE